MKKALLFFSFFGSQLVFPSNVSAHCPLCVVGAGAGLSLSRILGIDDTITGIWIGAFLGALSFWASKTIKKEYFALQQEVIYGLFFVTTIFSFYRFGLINEHNGLIYNLPKLTFGILAGGITFFVVDKINAYIKVKNGRILFPYQTLVFSLGAIALLSIIFFVILNYFI